MSTEGRGTGKRSCRQRSSRLMQRLFCCICARAAEGQSPPAAACRPQVHREEEEEDWESVRIMVEDLGTVNPGFVPTEEDAHTKVRKGIGRSASLVWAYQQAWQKRKLTPLSSLPLQSGLSSPNGEGRAHTPLFGEEDGPGDRTDGALLTLPLINLIPPTPSDVIDDDQFFDVNSEEDSVAHTSGSDCVDSVSSQAVGDQDTSSERSHAPDIWDGGSEQDSHPKDPAQNEEEGTVKGPPAIATTEDGVTSGDSSHGNPDQTKEQSKGPTPEPAKEQAKQDFLRSSFQVPPLPEYPRKRSFNAGINLLQFTEQNLDDLNNKDASHHELLKAKLRLLPLDAKMDLRKPAARTCSLGDHVTRSQNSHSVTKRSEEKPEEEGSPRQRRITVASYIPHTKDRNGNFAGKHSDGDGAKPLVELDTEGVCRWFISIGLQKCIPFIRGAGLCGSHIVTIDPSILEVLHVSALEERELLLSEIYRELHPPDSTTQKLDTLLESIGPHNVEKFTAALVSMSKSKSSPHVNCISAARSSFKFRDKGRHSTAQRSSHLVEITINALEQIMHLRTPEDTAVGKVMDSCLKTLGITDNKELFILRNKHGLLTELSFDQRIGDLLSPEKRLLELDLSKKEKQDIVHPKRNASHEAPIHNLQGNSRTKEEKIQELNQHVDSLQNVIHQVQELHQSLVSFCGELRNMEREPAPDAVCLADVETQLKLAQSRLLEKQQTVQAVQDRLSGLETRKNRRPEDYLLDKMKLDCQLFKEEIGVIHLNRQVARLKSALQEFQAKEHTKKRSSTLGQLVSPQCPAVLLMAHETRNAEGGYGFTARFTEDAGLVVVNVENTQLCLNDRLVEVNGVSVLESGEDELSDLLFRGPSARIVVLRKPPPLPPKPGCVPEPAHSPPQSDRQPAPPPPRCHVIAT